MDRRGRWPFVLAGTAALAVVLLGVLLGGRPAVAPATPAPASPVAEPSPSATSQPTAVPTTGPVAPLWVYFARDQLPPVGATVQAKAAVFPTERILRRVETLMRAGAQMPPAGSTNPAALIRQHTTVVGGFTQAVPGVAVTVDGDLATVEFDIEDWGVRGAAVTQGLVQQLVYTITEEPGIRRATITEKGKTGATIDQLVVDKPMAREDVAGYTQRPIASPFNAAGNPFTSTLTTSWSVDSVAPALARFVINVVAAPELEYFYPQFTVNAYDKTQMPAAKAELEITVQGGEDVTTAAAQVDRSPLRSIAVGRPNTFRAQVYRLGLDDLRPWRAVVLFKPTRIVIDVGAPPQAISDDGSTVIYSPAPGSSVDRTFRVTGVVRAFEAAFVWRVKDARGGAIANGHGTATIGTSPVWGGYDVEVSLPANVSGNVTLEVFQGSPRDGSEISKATIPLTVR